MGYPWRRPAVLCQRPHRDRPGITVNRPASRARARICQVGGYSLMPIKRHHPQPAAQLPFQNRLSDQPMKNDNPKSPTTANNKRSDTEDSAPPSVTVPQNEFPIVLAIWNRAQSQKKKKATGIRSDAKSRISLMVFFLMVGRLLSFLGKGQASRACARISP